MTIKLNAEQTAIKFHDAEATVLGTPEYYKYNLQHEVKVNGRWVFVGHYIPYAKCKEMVLKTVRGVKWIYAKYGDEENRWMMRDELEYLLVIE